MDGLLPIGYIEAERYGRDLDNLTGHAEAQNARFIENLDNFILTNFLEFRLYRNGKPVVDSVSVGRSHTLNQLGAAPPLENEDELIALLDRFLEFALPRSFTAESLAIELANRTRHLRDVIKVEIQQERERNCQMLWMAGSGS